ncbi:hypothetical protein [Algoriphagus sp. CAU 1675]|uniref:hypothetical protein n=1 Tax=Algoriphagus sp. CAU 1675 TaxID=3032597 RepID=UPI0023D9E203|nr:hypothetical protein [Algoriphagus sp. CAU 1675]MDF2157424.1 hypothetical protein [Algoriphagus sp. CAU 1675]
MESANYINEFKKEGILHLKEGNGKVLTFLKPEKWNKEMGQDWIYLLFDLFQIRSICEQFSEVSLDIVEFASKPTIYQSNANALVNEELAKEGLIRFSLIREPNWNKFLFQISQPVLVRLDSGVSTPNHTKLQFPLFSPSVKELYLGADGDVKIIKA